MPLPPKPKGQPDDLAEVDRALSVLQGRHPEHERVRREDQEARTRRAAALDEAARIESTKNRSRYVRLAAIAIPVVALVVFVGTLGKREMERRARVEHAADPFRAAGFTTVETSSPSAAGSLEATVEPGCLVAVSTDKAPLKVTRGGTSTDGASPMLFCTCASERVSIASNVGAGGGLTLLRADAATIGGSRAFPFAPFEVGSTMRSDEACNEASLDAWIDAKRYPPAPTDSPWQTTWPERRPLAAAGLQLKAVLGATSPFAVVATPKDSCLFAMSAFPTDRLGLRANGGATPITDAPGSLVRCAQEESTMLVTREGKGEVAVMIAPARAVAGMLGLREIIRQNGLAIGLATVPAADRGWDAKQVLLASQIPEATITMGAAPDVALDPEARVAALSFETPNALTPETPEGTYSYCDPPLDAKMREATCVFSGSQKWRTDAGAEAIGGIARAKLPFWLFAMQTASDPNALKGMTQLFTLARRIGRDGFMPTTLEALTELPNGVEVLGRTGEDAIIAVGVAPAEPYVYTLTEGAPWTLDDPPHVIPMKPLAKITLTSSLKTLPPKASRRTVVFRRQKH
ncbi:MAG: hypothetical protein JWP87_5050 [Labilithrix sp.]|nr:hypothetical protein [Labilithrix sp.]